MTTMELIERGIGHNCLSDAYELGRTDVIEEFVKLCDEVKLVTYQQYVVTMQDIKNIAEKLKEQSNE